jgi:hypothetical protein
MESKKRKHWIVYLIIGALLGIGIGYIGCLVFLANQSVSYAPGLDGSGYEDEDEHIKAKITKEDDCINGLWEKDSSMFIRVKLEITDEEGELLIPVYYFGQKNFTRCYSKEEDKIILQSYLALERKSDTSIHYQFNTWALEHKYKFSYAISVFDHRDSLIIRYPEGDEEKDDKVPQAERLHVVQGNLKIKAYENTNAIAAHSGVAGH